jgi:hypothetical protein
VPGCGNSGTRDASDRADLNTSTRPLVGGTAGRGATALGTTWSFAQGATGFFHTYPLLGHLNTEVSTEAGVSTVVRIQQIVRLF